MAYITTDKFQIIDGPIYDNETEEIDESKAFRCDDLIAPIISVINLKGYKTMYSCQGHYSEYKEKDDEEGVYVKYPGGYSLPYIMFDVNEIPSVPKGWYKVYSPRKISDKIKLKRELDLYHSADLNDIIGLGITDYVVAIYCKEEILEDLGYYEFYEAVEELMKKTYMWAKRLRRRKDE